MDFSKCYSYTVADVICGGSPRDMGRAQGRALRARIHEAWDRLSELEAFELARPRWLPMRLFRLLAERRVSKALKAPFSRDFPDMLERLEGIAESSGLRLDSLVLLNALEIYLGSLRDKTAPAGACSAFAVRAGRSRSGEPVIARNFDYVPLTQLFYGLREGRPAGGLKSLEFIAAPMAGAIDGVNERGLAIAYNYAFAVDDPRPAGTISMAVSEALARCSSVAEAAERIASRPRWGGGLLLLADAAGDIASLELSNTRVHLRRPEPGQDHIFHTNRYCGAAMREVELREDAIFGERAPRALRGKRVHDSAERRAARLAQLLLDGGALGERELKAVLADHGPEGSPTDTTLCVHGGYLQTTASFLYYPRSRRISYDFSSACRSRWLEASL